MKYLFDMGEVWHVYSDVGNQWIYQRLDQVTEQILDKSREDLPGPLGKLDLLKQLETERDALKKEVVHAEETKQNIIREYEKSYLELQTMAEELQKEGKLWRQRYLDLSYKISQNTPK